jgi:hypothetical protein
MAFQTHLKGRKLLLFILELNMQTEILSLSQNGPDFLQLSKDQWPTDP